MLSKNIKLLLLLFLTLVAVPNASLVSSQYAIPANFHGSYKVKIGDSNRYDVINATTSDQRYYALPFLTHNNTFFLLNLTRGDSLNFNVTGFNISNPNSEQIFMNLTLFTQHNVSHYQLTNFGIFVNPGFDTFAEAQQYENQTFQYIRSQNYFMYESANINFEHNGNSIMLLYFYSNASIYDINSTGQYSTQIMISFNWKTGWLNYLRFTEFDPNFKVKSDIFIQRHSSTTIFSTLLNYGTSLFELGSLLVVVLAIILVVNYRSYAKTTSSSEDSWSFTQYLKNRFSYHKKEPHKWSITTTEEALQTIQSILEETKDDAE